ncbi:hypothetical protein ACVINY_006731 [Sinorhizobium meliloti]
MKMFPAAKPPFGPPSSQASWSMLKVEALPGLRSTLRAVV